MRRTASEILHDLEARIARLEGRTAGGIDLSAYNDAMDPAVALPSRFLDKLVQLGLVDSETLYGSSPLPPYEEMERDEYRWTPKAYRFGLQKATRNSPRWEDSPNPRTTWQGRTAEDFFADELEADEMFAGRTWDGEGDQTAYNDPPAPKNRPDCYSADNWEGLGKPGQGETCYRLHNNYGEANSGKPGSPQRAEYNKKYREQWMDSKSIKRPEGKRPGRR